MKKMRKIVALLIAMVMVFGMSISVFAATITINKGEGANNGTDNTTYDAYQIFSYSKAADSTFDGTTDSDLGAGSETGLTYTIAKDSPWYQVVVDSTYFTLNGKGIAAADGTYTEYYVSLASTDMNTAAGAKTIAEYFRDHMPNGVTPTVADFKAGSAQSVPDGYYLITSSLGELVIAATSDITITEKNTYPTLDKKAEEADYGVGDDVPYTITVVIPANVDNTKDVTVHDELDDVLSFNDDLKVSINGATAVELTGTIASLVANPDDECTFEIVIETADITAETTLVFTYTAELTSAAAADHGYVNKAYLDYSDYETTPKTPEIKTYDFDLEKIFTGSNADTLTATFTLGDKMFIKDATGYVVADSDDADPSADIVVKNSETVNVRGLAAGTYTLTETETAAGYNPLSGTITVTIADDGTVTFSELDLVSDANGKVTITNNNGTVLPSTGGMGTTIFYIVGAILVIGAGVVLVTRRRMNMQ
ncbi:MAG: isopeptide-forming domain-containing fimbrial protein [Firmicutes bacterium]|nr:isopeptide-forming domain-containing fimbrial protein [Bacillota bacterium]